MKIIVCPEGWTAMEVAKKQAECDVLRTTEQLVLMPFGTKLLAPSLGPGVTIGLPEHWTANQQAMFVNYFHDVHPKLKAIFLPSGCTIKSRGIRTPGHTEECECPKCEVPK